MWRQSKLKAILIQYNNNNNNSNNNNGTYYVPGTFLSTLHILTHLFLLRRKILYLSHFTNEEVEPQGM